MADNNPENTEQVETAPEPGQATTETAAENATEVSVTDHTNANGLTDEEQAKYEDYYTLHGEYNPDQSIPIQSRTFGIVEEDNPFLSSEASDGWSEDMVLGQLNLQCEYNHAVPQGTTMSRKEQQKLFHSMPTQSVGLVTHLSRSVLKKLKSETGHLLGCNQGDYMEVFLRRVLQGSVVPIIDGTVKRLPVRGEFMLHINEEGRLDLEWMKMSMHKLHRFLDLLIHDIKGAAEVTFVPPKKEATLLAIDLVEQLKNFNI